MPISIGVIGTGMIVERSHLPGLVADPRCTVKAIAGRNSSRLDALSATFGIQGKYRDWRLMLEQENLDAVTIATPPFLHREMAVAAMNKGVDVLIEKPLAPSLADVDAIVKTARDTKRIAMVQQTLRYNPTFRMAANLVADGAIGTVTRIHGALLNRGPRSWAPRSTWFFDPALAGGGLLLDSGVHIIDLIRHFTGADFTDLHGELVYREEEGIEEEASLAGWLDTGVQVSVDLSWHVDPPQASISLFGTQGYLQADAKSPFPILIHQKDGSVIMPAVDRPTWFGTTYQHFIDCCLSRTAPLSSVADNRSTIGPLLALYDKPTTIRRQR